jgi:UDP-N-acetylmuramoylalanine-D-glutamate ligase
VLLLSPGATSYGEFADYRERSARFRSLLLQRGMTLAG